MIYDSPVNHKSLYLVMEGLLLNSFIFFAFVGILGLFGFQNWMDSQEYGQPTHQFDEVDFPDRWYNYWNSEGGKKQLEHKAMMNNFLLWIFYILLAHGFIFFIMLVSS